MAGLGYDYLNKGQYEKAFVFDQQLIKILASSGDRLKELTTLNTMGKAYQEQNQYQSALKFYQQALMVLQVI